MKTEVIFVIYFNRLAKSQGLVLKQSSVDMSCMFIILFVILTLENTEAKQVYHCLWLLVISIMSEMTFSHMVFLYSGFLCRFSIRYS